MYGNIIQQFDYIRLIDAIPKEWRIGKNESLFFKIGKEETNITQINSNRIYWHIIKKVSNEPTCINAWIKRLNMKINKKDWKDIFELPYKCTKDHRIISLQIKIIHRFYPCQKLVSKWDCNVASQCKFCNESNCDIVHTFATCDKLRYFWDNLQNLINSIRSENHIQINTKIILFGLIPYTINSHFINHCIIHGKLFIHNEVQNNNLPAIKKFITYYKHILEIEREYLTERNDRHFYKIVFQKMSNQINLTFSD